MRLYLDHPIARIRRNHALEHASMQLLARIQPGVRMAGYSLPDGFFIVGSLRIDQIRDAVNEARMRLESGEKQLAIHPHCGTNYAASGLLAALAAWVAMLGGDNSARSRLERLPLVAALITLVLIVTQPLGPMLQARFTTDANLQGLQVVQIDRFERSKIIVHRVLTRPNLT